MLPAIYDFWKAAFDAEKAAGHEGWAHAFSFLNLLGYITFRAATASTEVESTVCAILSAVRAHGRGFAEVGAVPHFA